MAKQRTNNTITNTNNSNINSSNTNIDKGYQATKLLTNHQKAPPRT